MSVRTKYVLVTLEDSATKEAAESLGDWIIDSDDSGLVKECAPAQADGFGRIVQFPEGMNFKPVDF